MEEELKEWPTLETANKATNTRPASVEEASEQAREVVVGKTKTYDVPP